MFSCCESVVVQLLPFKVKCFWCIYLFFCLFVIVAMVHFVCIFFLNMLNVFLRDTATEKIEHLAWSRKASTKSQRRRSKNCQEKTNALSNVSPSPHLFIRICYFHHDSSGSLLCNQTWSQTSLLQHQVQLKCMELHIIWINAFNILQTLRFT